MNLVNVLDSYLQLCFLAQITGFWLWFSCEKHTKSGEIRDSDEQLKLRKEKMFLKNF